MQTRSFRGSGEPAWVIASSNACDGLGPDPRRALGPAAIRAASTGRTHDRTRPMLHQRKKLLSIGRRPHMTAGSTGRRNTGVKFLCRGFKSQGLAWPLIELAGHFVEMGLRVHRQVGSFRKILSQQAIGVLVGTALPWTLRIAKANIHDGR